MQIVYFTRTVAGPDFTASVGSNLIVGQQISAERAAALVAAGACAYRDIAPTPAHLLMQGHDYGGEYHE